MTHLDKFIRTKTEIIDDDRMILQMSLNRVDQLHGSFVVADSCHSNNDRQHNICSDRFRIQPRRVRETKELEMVRVQVDVVF